MKSANRLPWTVAGMRVWQVSLVLVLTGCLPTLKIEGEFTVIHQVVHSVEQKGREVTIRDLKMSGLVGERYDGYLGLLVQEVDEAIRSRVEESNRERRARYQEMADQYEGIQREDMEIQAGRALMDREQSGFFILPGPETGWQRK